MGGNFVSLAWVFDRRGHRRGAEAKRLAAEEEAAREVVRAKMLEKADEFVEDAINKLDWQYGAVRMPFGALLQRSGAIRNVAGALRSPGERSGML